MKGLKVILLLFILGFPLDVSGQSLICDSLYQDFRDTLRQNEERLNSAYQYVISLKTCFAFDDNKRQNDGLDQKTFNQIAEEKGIEYDFFHLAKTHEEPFATNKFSLSKRLKFYERGVDERSDDVVVLITEMIFTELRFVSSENIMDPRIDNLIQQLPKYINDSILLAEQYVMINNVFKVKDIHTKNVLMCLKAIEIYEKYPNKQNECAAVMSQLAYFLIEVGNEDLSQEYRLKAIEINKQTKDSFSLQFNYRHLAYNELMHERYQSGYEYTLKAIDISARIKNEKERLYNVFCSGILLRKLGRLEEALDIELSSYNAYLKIGLNIGLQDYLGNEIGQTYLDLQNYKEALKWGNKTVKIAQNFKGFKESYDVLYRANMGLGNYKEAFENYQNYVSYKDSLVNENNTRESTRLELESKFQKERFSDSINVLRQKESQDLIYNTEIKKQKVNRNVIVGIGLGFLALALALLSRLRFVRKTQKVLIEKNRIIEIEKENAKSSERAKQQFLANMSHEIRTPMNAIKGMTDIVLRRKPAIHQLKYLNAIKESSKSLLVIINDILDLSKVESGKMDFESIPISLLEVTENVRLVMHFKAEEKGLELHVSAPREIPALLGAPSRLRQILINLVGNAIKFTDKGTITISFALLSEEAEAPGIQSVQFTVSDTGIGINDNRLAKVFESFEQEYSDTSRKYGGTGLGLAISKKMVESQGGNIWVESKKGKGSQFHFIIPFKIDSSRPKKLQKTIEASHQKQKIALKGLKILLVEDNEFNAIVAQDELQDAIDGTHIVQAENGIIALEHLTDNDFDIILMDVQMPGMNGYEATLNIRNLNSEKSKTPIIAMTANVMKAEVNRCYQAGMDDFIGKPFDVKELILKIYKLHQKKVLS